MPVSLDGNQGEKGNRPIKVLRNATGQVVRCTGGNRPEPGHSQEQPTLVADSGCDKLAAVSEPTTNRRVPLDTAPFKRARASFLSALSDRLDQGLDGLSAASELARWLDGQLAELRRHLEHLLPEVPLALYATGSYGRGWLAPASDVDLLVVYLDGQTDPKALATFIGALETSLRDIGYRVGLAARFPEQCLELAAADLTIATSMMEARLLWRAPGLELPFGGAERLSEVVVGELRAHGRGRPFATAIRRGCDARHRRYGQTVYRLEPNIKRGRGGLRDVQALLWSARVLHGARTLDEITAIAGVDNAAKEAFRAAASFVFKVRVALHLEGGRFANDRMTFERQEGIAARLLGAAEGDGPLPVERFMQRYYQAAETVASDALGWQDIWLLPEPEPQQAVVSPGICLRQRHLDLTRTGDRLVGHGAVPTASPVGYLDTDTASVGTATAGLTAEARAVLADNPLRLYELAIDLERPIHPMAHAHVKGAAATLRAEGPQAASLLRVLSAVEAPRALLDALRLSGLLTAVLPEFEPVRALAQHDVYHAYTVDVHLLRTHEELKRLLRGELQGGGSSQHFGELAARVGAHRHRTLLVAGLLHDIGKGRGGNHSELGAGLVVPIGLRLGLTEIETRRLGLLVRHHLLLAKVSQRRDLEDPSVIRQVALAVGSVSLLEDLVLLTVADMRAVGPERLSEWKAQLLLELTDRVRHALDEGLDVEWRRAEVRRTIAAATAACLAGESSRGGAAALEASEVAALLDELPRRYLLGTPPGRIAQHLALTHRTEAVSFQLHSDGEEDTSELVVSTDDRPGALATIAGVLSAQGVTILTAEIVTMLSARTLDVFRIQTRAGRSLADAERERKLHDRLTAAFAGELDLGSLLARRRRDQPDGPIMPDVPTVVSVDQQASDRYTVLEVKTRDRIGLLWQIATKLLAHGCSVALSRILTEGIRAIDVFYVEDAAGERKLTDAEAAALAAALSKALGEPRGTPP